MNRIFSQSPNHHETRTGSLSADQRACRRQHRGENNPLQGAVANGKKRFLRYLVSNGWTVQKNGKHTIAVKGKTAYAITPRTLTLLKNGQKVKGWPVKLLANWNPSGMSG